MFNIFSKFIGNKYYEFEFYKNTKSHKLLLMGFDKICGINFIVRQNSMPREAFASYTAMP